MQLKQNFCRSFSQAWKELEDELGKEKFQEVLAVEGLNEEKLDLSNLTDEFMR